MANKKTPINKSKNIIIVIITICLVLGIGILSVALALSSRKTTSSTTTKNWQTYSNSTYQFSIKYPKEYLVKIEQETPEQLWVTFRKINDPEEFKDIEGICIKCTLSMIVYKDDFRDNPKAKNPEEQSELEKKSGINSTQVIINGKTAYLYDNKDISGTIILSEDKTLVIYAKKNDDTYDRFLFHIRNNYTDAYAILSTLKIND